MGIKQIKPTNPASRQQSRSDFVELTVDRPHKPLTEGKPSTAAAEPHGDVTAAAATSGATG